MRQNPAWLRNPFFLDVAVKIQHGLSMWIEFGTKTFEYSYFHANRERQW
jgi:hypothetical protein